MEQVAEIFKEKYGVQSFNTFTADAIYLKDLDCVKYKGQDTTVIADRIDKYLTIYYNRKDEAVGFKLKGFRWYFETQLSKMYDLTDDDFIDLMEFIRHIVRDQASDIFENQSGELDRIKRAYKTAIEIAKKHQLKLNAYQFKQAA